MAMCFLLGVLNCLAYLVLVEGTQFSSPLFLIDMFSLACGVHVFKIKPHGIPGSREKNDWLYRGAFLYDLKVIAKHKPNTILLFNK